jgi:hypothetical protein
METFLSELWIATVCVDEKRLHADSMQTSCRLHIGFMPTSRSLHADFTMSSPVLHGAL